MQFAGATPGACGSWQTPMKLFGNSVQTRWISVLHRSDQRAFPAASDSWCAMPEARGENSVRSVPRSFWLLSWPVSMLARIASSLIAGGGGSAAAFPLAATCAFRQAACSGGEVV